jgi:ABC-type phosphate transport system substrate-binding protein
MKRSWTRLWRGDWPGSLCLLLAVGAIGGLVGGARAGEGFRLIVHTAVPTRTLNRDAVAQIFTKKTVKWLDGSRVTPVDLPVDSKIRETFSRAIHGKSSVAVDAYWQKQIFSGRDLPPLTKASDSEVLAFVRATPGAIGYVSPGADSSGVKVVEVE